MSKEVRRNLLKVAKTLGWFVGVLLLLLVAFVYSLRFPAVQNYITTKALHYFHERVDTQASIGRLYIDFPSNITIEDLYVEDQNQDTLVYSQYLTAQTDLWALMNNQLRLNEIEINGLVGNVIRPKDKQDFNYQFIVDAFASESPQPADSAASFDFSIGDVVLQNIRGKYFDAITGIDISGDIGTLLTEFEVFDLNQPAITITSVTLKDTRSKLRLFEGVQTADLTPTDTTSEKSEFILGGNEVTLSQVSFQFEDEPSNIKLNNDIGNLQLTIDSLDITNNVYTAKRLLVENSFVSLDQFSTNKEDSPKTDSVSGAAFQDDTISLLAGAASATISNTSFRYYDHNQPLAAGFDPAHLWIQKVNSKMLDTYFDAGNLEGTIKSLSVSERGGLTIQQLKGKWSYTDQAASIENLTLKTNRTNIDGMLKVKYPSIKALAENPESLWFEANLVNSIVDLNDVYYFQSALKNQLSFLQPYHRFKLTLNTKGYLNDFKITDLNFIGFGATRLIAKGAIKGLPAFNTASYKLNVSQFLTTRQDLRKVIPDSLLAENIKLPDTASLKLDFKGKFTDFDTQAEIKTSMGDINFNGSMQQGKDSVYSYKGDLKVRNLQMRSLLSNEDLGILSLNTFVDGRGFAIEELNTLVRGNIQRVDYKDYKYKAIDVNGTFKNKQFDGHLSLEDPNLDFDFDGLVNFNDSVPVYEFTLDLRQADFKALNLSQDDFKARAIVKAGLKAKSLESLNGTLTVDDFTMAKGESFYQLDSMTLVAESHSSLTDIEFKSGIVDAKFNGNFELVTLPDVLQNHFNRYFSTSDSLGGSQLKPQDFTFNIDFKKPEFFSDFVPQLTDFVPGKIEGNYNSAEWMIDVDVIMKEIVYQGTAIDSLGINVTSDKSSLVLNTRIAEVSAAGFDFNNISFQAKVEQDYVKTDLKIYNDKGEDRYHFGGKLSLTDQQYAFQFLPDEFLLNYEEWTVKPENSFEFVENGVWVSNFAIAQSNEEIRVESSKTDKGDTVLNVEFDKFDLSFLGKFEETQAYILGGVLNGSLSADVGNGSLKADLDVSKFSFKGDTLGNIDLQATNQTNRTSLDIKVQGKRNELVASGTVIQDEFTNLDLSATINRLDISTLQAYTGNELSQMEGVLTGDFKIKGTVVDPDINGRLVFNDVVFKVNYLGTVFYINNDEIRFTKTGISFNQFTILDDSEDKLTVDGVINSEDYRTYDFNLKVASTNFQVLNTTAKNNDLIYGDLRINSTAEVTGNLQNPKVRLNLGVAEGSQVTYVIPESEIEVQNRKGIVEFFDKDLEKDEFFQEQKESNLDTLDVWISGMDLRANIDITKESTFGVVIDPITGDKLTVSGDADLTMAMRPSGDMTMTGRYEVNDGSYDLNFYGIAKRKFDIIPGSTLLWTGDPLNARMDVSASYFVRAAPLDTEISRKVPFTVFLNLKGELLAPEISFRLALAEEGAAPPSVQTWMASVNQQESILNKQVFSLLLFKSFMSSSSGGNNGNIAQSTARNSVSRILSNQLNRLGSKIEGVELSFDLQSYQDYNQSGSTVGRTELELGLSKQFFDNRVVVKVAGNFNLEGKSDEQQNVSDFAGDIKIEYKLTEDGRYRLVGFRQNEYDNLLQGEVAKTGVGVIFVRDYNTLKELFNKSAREEEDND